jgi:NAD-dependent deacetylase
MPDQAQVKSLASLIKQSGSTVFFGGAGVSTESGVPDFRSESGLYSALQVYGQPPERLLSHELFLREPQLFFRYYKENLIYPDARPNAAHLALAKLEDMGLCSAVATQNIDGLHSMAGSQNVLELHGSNLRQYCIGCGKNYSLEYVLDPKNSNGYVPKCGACGCIVRPRVVLYGEQLDSDVMEAAIQEISKAELLIVGGTSLAVYPAAGLLRYFCGDSLVVINKSETPGDRSAKLVIHDKIGEVLAAALEYI